jgi:predicted ester cyclase
MNGIAKNIATVRAYAEVLNKGDFVTLRKLFTDDATVQGVTGGGPVDAAIPIWRDLHNGLNMHLEIKSIVADGDTGRWTGPFLGFANPTGKTYQLVAMEWFEMRDGLIARRWGARDAAAQANQLGFPSAAGTCTASPAPAAS